MKVKPTYEELERRVQELEKIESENKYSKEALRNSEVPYLLLFEHAYLGIFIAQDGYLKVPNPYLLQILGYSRAELEEQPFSLFIHPEYLSLVTTRHQDRLSGKTGLPQTYDFRVISKTGMIIWVQISTVLIQFKNRPATLNFLHDITERKRMEEALKESEERFNLAMDACKDGIFEWDLETREVYYSPGWKRMLGYEPDELADNFSVWEKLTRPEDVEKCLRIMQEVLEGRRERLEVEFEMRHKDGHWIHILSRSNIYNDANGKPVRLVGTHVDITDSKQQRENLRLNESRYRKAQALAKVGNWEYNLKTAEIWASEQAKIIFGITPDKDIYSREEVESCIIEQEMVYQALVDLIETGKPYNLEYDIITKNVGKIRTIVSIAEIEKDGARNHIISGVIHDITERKQIEEALQASLAEKEVLLREVHHRVKNNMAAIIGLFNLQRQTMEDPQVQTVLTELSSRVRAMSLVHEKLYRSSSLARIDFQDYIQSLTSHLRTSFGSPKIRCEIDSAGVKVPLDLAVPCGMIINELITNSLKYAFPAEHSGASDKVDRILIAMSNDKDIFSLSVADNGIGLPLGFDLNEAKTLGLVLVRMLGQHQLGGQYHIDQTGGTRFTLTFRRHGRKTH